LGMCGISSVCPREVQICQLRFNSVMRIIDSDYAIKYNIIALPAYDIEKWCDQL
jgi:hypothetical protein